MRASVNLNYGIKKQGYNSMLENRTHIDKEQRLEGKTQNWGLDLLSISAQENEGWFPLSTFLYFCTFYIFFKGFFSFSFCLFVIKVRYAHKKKKKLEKNW